MHKFFTPSENINGSLGKILGDDVKHIYKVLRIGEGEEVVINNLQGKEFLCTIKDVTKTEVTFEIIKELNTNNESLVKIDLYQGLPKSQKMDLIVQKGTELGINTFIPTVTSRVDVKLKGEFKKLDRLNKISLEACKQSKRSFIPKVVEPLSFEEALEKINQYDLFLVPYENAENFGMKALVNEIDNLSTIKNVGVMVGPEGGFEEGEIELLKERGAYIITLGRRILRTETAGFTLTSLIQYELGDLGGNI